MKNWIACFALASSLASAHAEPCAIRGTALSASVTHDDEALYVSIQGHEVAFVRTVVEGVRYERTGNRLLCGALSNPQATCSGEVTKTFGPFPPKLTFQVSVSERASCSFLCHKNDGMKVDDAVFNGYVCHAS